MTQNLQELIAALRATAEIPGLPAGTELGHAVFTGSGDSLASAYVAARVGHRALSAGDIEWQGEVPPLADTIVGISNSGTSGATIRSLRRGKQAGLRTVAVTSSPDTPLGQAADLVQAIPALGVDEQLPVAGHLVLAMGVASASGIDIAQVPARLADALDGAQPLIDQAVAALPAGLPMGITILSLPELRSGGNFWSLKFIEACGIPARDVPLEESGHVDYFIGPEPYVVFELVGRAGVARFERLDQALRANGMTVIPVDLGSLVAGDDLVSDLVRDLAAAVVGTFVARDAALGWGRPPFRGGAVNMDASHIKIEY